MKSRNIFNSHSDLIRKIFLSTFFMTMINVCGVHAQRNLFDNFEQRSKAIGKFAHYSNTAGAYRSGAISTIPCFGCDDEHKYAGGFFTADKWNRFSGRVADYNEHSIAELQHTVSELTKQIESLREEMDHIRSVLTIDSKLTSKQMFLVQ